MTSITECKKVTIKKVLKTALTIAFWLGLWQLIYIIVGLDVLVASPFGVAKRLIEFLPDGTIIDRYGTYDDYLNWLSEQKKQ